MHRAALTLVAALLAARPSAGAPSPPPKPRPPLPLVKRHADDAATTRFQYDEQGNRTRAIAGELLAGQPKATTYVYDGYDRLVRVRDAGGNETRLRLDPMGHVVRATFVGDQPGLGPVRLADAHFVHDELGRPTTTRTQWFGSGLPERAVTTRREYDARSRLTFVTDAAGETTRLLYDGAGRSIAEEDAAGNRVETERDPAGNPVRVTVHQRSTGGLVAPRAQTTEAAYDALDRLVLRVDAGGHATRWTHDARGNVLLVSDPQGPVPAGGGLNAPGNVRRFEYDALDRLVLEEQLLYVGGAPSTAGGEPAGLDLTNPFDPDGRLTRRWEYDRDGLPTAFTDDAGRRTRWEHDGLGRRTRTILASGAVYAARYDRDDNVVGTTDPTGTTSARSYDGLDRLVSVAFERGPGVVGTTTQSFAYDGLGRLVQALDRTAAGVGPAPGPGAGPGGSVRGCAWSYDSLGRVLVEQQDGQAVGSEWTADGRRTALRYPDGRVLRAEHDALGREVRTTWEPAPGSPGGLVAEHAWIGPGALPLRRALGNGTALSFVESGEDAGYDALQRAVRLRWLSPGGGGAFVDREYAYDRASVRTGERRRDDGDRSDAYEHDSASRLVRTVYGPPAPGAPGGGEPGVGPREVGYRLDGVGNRRERTERPGAEGTAEATTAYAVDAVHRYVAIGETARVHDANGNLTDDGARTYRYDALDRLVEVRRKPDGRLLAEYEHFADGRRARVRVWDPALEAVVRDVRLVHDGPRELAEVEAATGEVQASFVWAPEHVDALVAYERTARHPLGPGRFYAHQDARQSVVAITDAAGQVVERRRYDDFGAVEVLLRDGSPLPGSGAGGAPGAGAPGALGLVGLDTGFQGRRHDVGTGLIYFRARHYDPATGRFVQRDPVWDPLGAGNPYTFVGNSPVTLTDPSGEIAPLVAVAIVAAAGAAIHGAIDVGVQAYTSGGYSSGSWDWGSTAKAAGLGALEGALSLIGGPGAGSALRLAGRRAGAEAVGLGLAAGVEAVAQGYLGQDGGDDWGGAGAWGDEDEGEFDNCFLAGHVTETTTRGVVPIEDVRLKDRIAPPPGHSCDDPHCGEVVNLFRNWTDQVVTITAVTRPRAREHRSAARDGGEAGEEDGEPPPSESSQTIRCTPGHPFYVEGRGWVFAGDLRAGDAFEARGLPVVVASVEVRADRAETFNFEVRCHHTYRVSGYAGQPAVLVHNISRRVVSALFRRGQAVQHYNKHVIRQAEWGRTLGRAEYRRNAANLLKRDARQISNATAPLAAPRSGIFEGVSRRRGGADLVRYDAKLNRFAVYSPIPGRPDQFRIRTFFRPRPAVHGRASNWDHFLSEIQ